MSTELFEELTDGIFAIPTACPTTVDKAKDNHNLPVFFKLLLCGYKIKATENPLLTVIIISS